MRCFDFAVVERIIDLHEVRLLAGKHGFDRGELKVAGRSDADIAAYALRFPFLELRQQFPRVVDVVELEEIELFGLEPRQRTLELVGIGRFELGGDEHLVAQAPVGDRVAEHDLGIAIDRRRVDQPPAMADERGEHRGRLLPGRRVGGVEHLRGAEADGRYLLAAPRDRAREQRARLGESRRRQRRRAGEDREFTSGHACSSSQPPAATVAAAAAGSFARRSWARPRTADSTSQPAATGTATSAIPPSFSPRPCRLSNTQPYKASEPR